MGKISPVSSKYIIHASIGIEGVVDKPDVIGAIFGQTEGLLGADLELRELQRSGRIGRIEVNVDTRSGKTQGTIIIPSSLDKAETSIVAAALEIIQRIGPCNAKIRCENIEDVRVSKRNLVITRAKELLKNMMDNVMPDSQELADEVAYSVRVMEITEYGNDRLPAGPAIDESDDIIVVEGRADVLNLLKHGIKNCIALNGTSVPQTIIDLSRKKEVTALVDGDRGGDLIIKELATVAEIDFVTKAPDGKEVEEITKKEIHKALRSRISAEQAKLDITKEVESLPQNNSRQRPQFQRQPYQQQQQRPQQTQRPRQQYAPSAPVLSPDIKNSFKKMAEDLIGTRGAYILDNKLNILGKVPITELNTTIKSLGSGVHAVVFDGVVEKDIVETAEKLEIKFIVGMDAKVKSQRLSVLTINDL
ncbi:MAG: DNA primase DnaG [Candidatus Woesearchaeota archaeon]